MRIHRRYDFAILLSLCLLTGGACGRPEDARSGTEDPPEIAADRAALVDPQTPYVERALRGSLPWLGLGFQYPLGDLTMTTPFTVHEGEASDQANLAAPTTSNPASWEADALQAHTVAAAAFEQDLDAAYGVGALHNGSIDEGTLYAAFEALEALGTLGDFDPGVATERTTFAGFTPSRASSGSREGRGSAGVRR